MGYDEAFTTMNKRFVGIFGFAETNVDWNVVNKESKVKKLASKIFGHAQVIPVTSAMTFGTIHKPGRNFGSDKQMDRTDL